MPDVTCGSIPAIVDLHVDEACGLYARRGHLTQAPLVDVRGLRRADERLCAHLDGVAVAGGLGRAMLERSLTSGSAGAMFAAAVCAIQEGDKPFLKTLFAHAAGAPARTRELTSALGWVSAPTLKGLGVALLGSSDPFHRGAGIAACAMHRVDPGILSAHRLEDAIPAVRARALRTAGEIGCVEAAPQCRAAVRDEDEDCRFWASRSSVLLGHGGSALELLTRTGLGAGPHRRRGFRFALQAMSITAAHDVLSGLARDPENLPWLIQGSGIVGDPVYVPWLIKHMADPKSARAAGEAFTLITGAELNRLQLEANRPQDFESGPNDDPGESDVDIDVDEGSPWPHATNVEKWWAVNSRRFHKGERYFMGAPVTREHCIHVLKTGYQRQRILAAHYLCLLEPGTPLFNTSAPAWRQQKLLEAM